MPSGLFLIRMNLDLWNLKIAGGTPLAVITSIARPLPTQDTSCTHTQKKHEVVSEEEEELELPAPSREPIENTW
jgi:hypothetical protein